MFKDDELIQIETILQKAQIFPYGSLILIQLADLELAEKLHKVFSEISKDMGINFIITPNEVKFTKLDDIGLAALGLMRIPDCTISNSIH